MHGVFRWFEYQDGPGPFDSLYWIKGQSLQVDLETDKPVCACLEGACTLMSDVVTQYDFNLAEDAFARVMARLAKMIRAGDPTFPDRESDEMTVILWNDVSCRTRQQVVDLVTDALVDISEDIQVLEELYPDFYGVE